MDYLFNLFSANLKTRYLTLLKNLKYKSNSFYDAYNSLMEELLREIALKELGLNKIKGSIHDILTKEEVKDYFLNVLGLTNTSYKKLLDYASKLNSHKHKNEHELTLESAIAYFKIMYDFLYAYTSFKGLSIPNYDENYITNLYGSGLEKNDIYNRLALMENKIDSIYKNSGALENDLKLKKEKEAAAIKAKINDLRNNGNRLYSYCEPVEDIKGYKIKLGIIGGSILLIIMSTLILATCLISNYWQIFWSLGIIFILYYVILLVKFLSLKDEVKINEFRNFHIVSMIRLSDGNYVPYKDKTMLSLAMVLLFSFYLFLVGGFIIGFANNIAIENTITMIIILGIILAVVFRNIGYSFLEKYENIYLYDDEAEVTFWPEFNQFLEFKYKK